MNTTNRQRGKYTLSPLGIHWKEIDEDVSFESFYYEDEKPITNNEVAGMFNECSELNVSEVAKHLNIHKSLLYKYIYGTKKPNPERIAEIKSVLRKVGERLLAVSQVF